MNASSERDPLELLAEEFADRHRKGERPAISEYVAKFPQWAEEIRELFPALAMIEQFKPAPELPPGLETAAESGNFEAQPFGDFRIIREVGRGGMGIVFEAEQISLGRHVALKVLLSHRFLDSLQVQRFQREARSAGRLHHTNIVPVHGVGEYNGTYYYVMQFIPGLGMDQVLRELQRFRETNGSRDNPVTGEPTVNHTEAARPSVKSLSQALRTGSFSRQPPPGMEEDASPAAPAAPGDSSSGIASVQLPGQIDPSSLGDFGYPYWQSVARIGMQVADALAHAHDNGTLHRDIKPSNLLLDNHGIVWITDFGLAKAVNDSDNLTHSGDIVGTLRYMAPERFDGKGDMRSDIYSLGLSLYELLTLRPAFDQAERNQLIESVLRSEPPRPRKLNHAIPRDLETIVLKAMEPSPNRRYQTADELAADLRRFLDGQSIHARQVTPWDRAAKAIRRQPAVSALAALLILAVGIGFALVMWKWREAEHQKTLITQQAADNQALAESEKQLREAAETAQKKAARQAELASLEAAKADEVANFLIGLFQGSDPLGLSGYRFGPPPSEVKVPTAHDLLRQGTEGIWSDLADAPEIQATVMDHLGRTWLSLGSIADAEPLLQAALEWRLQHYGIEHPDTAQSLAALGMLRYIQGNYDKAVSLLRQASHIADKTLGPSDPDAGRIKFFFGCVLLESRGPSAAVTTQEAAQAFEELVKSLRPHAKQRPSELAFALSGLAMARQVQKDYTGALQCLAEAAALLPKEPEANAFVGPLVLSIKAVTNWKLGNHQLAEQQTEKCIEQFQEILGRDHPAVTYFQVYTARLIHKAGDLDRAEAMLRQGVADAKRAYGRQPRTARTMKYLADLLLDRGKLDEAETVCQDALSIDLKILGSDHRETKDLQRLLSNIKKARVKALDNLM